MTGTLPEILSSEDVARWLHVSPTQVRRLAAAGEIPGVQIGSLWRFSRQALEQWIGGAA